MSGDATFSGARYQARAIAYVYARMLGQSRLMWFQHFDDTPVAISGETGGPGDDFRIEFANAEAIEVQAKRGLSAGEEYEDVLTKIASHDSQMPVLLLVNSASSRKIYDAFPRDYERIRGGRAADVSAYTAQLLKRRPEFEKVFRRLYVRSLDVDQPTDSGWDAMATHLKAVLEQPEQLPAAQAILAEDAVKLCADRLRRNVRDAQTLLTGAKIRLRPVGKEARWTSELDSAQRFLNDSLPEASLAIVDALAASFVGQEVSPDTRARQLRYRAASLLRLERYAEAVQAALAASDVLPSQPEPLELAARGLMVLGSGERAKEMAAKAVAVGPTNTQAWCAHALIANFNGEELTPPPVEVAQTPEYQFALANCAATDGDWNAVVQLTGVILATGRREPDWLWLRTCALINCCVTETRPERVHEIAGEAERLTNEILERLRDNHPLTVKSLGLRAETRRMMGRPEEADADAELAYLRNPDDPDAVRRRALFLHKAGDKASALGVLRTSSVSKDLPSLALRCQLLAEAGQKEEARLDLAGVFSLLDKGQCTEVDCYAAADAAVMLRDAERAEVALGKAPPKVMNSDYRTLTLGRVAFLKGDPVEGSRLLRSIIGSKLAEVPVELAIRQRRAGRHRDAIATFKQIGLAAIPADALPEYAASLVECDALVDAQEVLDHLRQAGGVLPEWGVRLAVHLALAQEDTDQAIPVLTELLTRTGDVPPAARINLVSALLEVERQEEARTQLEPLLANPSLTAEECERVILMLRAAVSPEAAISFGAKCLRKWPHEARVHRAVVSVAFGSDVQVNTPIEIGAGCSFRLDDRDAQQTWWTVVEGDAADPLRNELTVATARSRGLLGKKVDDTIPRSAASWSDDRLTIKEIVTAETHAVRDAAFHFAERFPDEPFFATSFRVNDFSTVNELAPLIATLEGRKNHAESVLQQYRQQVFPLGFIAGALGTFIPNAMLAVQGDTSPDAVPLVTEWPDQRQQRAASAAALEAKAIVLTRSALHTAQTFDLLELVRDAFPTLLAPRSLVRELKLELRDAERDSTKGRSFLTSGRTGLEVQEITASHPLLQRHAASIRAQLNWVQQNTKPASRPLQSVQDEGEPRPDLRSTIGFSSADAFEVVRCSDSMLYADDLGLRRILPEGVIQRSFSTITLLNALRGRGAIDEARFRGLMLQLVDSGYAFIPASPELLIEALRQYGEFAPQRIGKVFRTLAAPTTILADAATVVAAVVKATAVSPVHISGVERVVTLAMEAMRKAWQPRHCALALVGAVQENCFLLPEVMRKTQDAVARLLRNDFKISIAGS